MGRKNNYRSRGSSLEEALEFHSIPEPNSGCLLWTGSTNQKGYAHVYWDGRIQSATRLVWARANGQSVPAGMSVCHKCDVPSCINPDHLFVGTNAENMADMVRKGRHRKHGLSGSALSHSKLNEEKVQRIRQDTRPSTVLAALYGVSPRTIRDARSGVLWRHV